MVESRKDRELRTTSPMEVNQNIRKTLVVMKIDPNSLKYSTSNGTVTLSGNVKFIGKKVDPAEMPRELAKIEERICSVKGVRKVNIDLDAFEKNKQGDYAMTGRYKAELMQAERAKKEAMKSGGGKKKVSKNAPICSNKKCNQSINFCPHCGDALDLKLLIKAAEKLMKGGFKSASGGDLFGAMESKKSEDSWDLSSLESDYAKQQEEEEKEKAEEAKKGIQGAVAYDPNASDAIEDDDDPKSKIREMMRQKKEADLKKKKAASQKKAMDSINWDKFPGSDD